MMGLYNTVLKPNYESRMREQEFEWSLQDRR
jgi:hypothetical protein